MTTFADAVPSAYTSDAGHYFTLAELRASDRSFDVDVTEEHLASARARAEELLEKACNVAFVPRTKTETLYGAGTGALLLSEYEVSAITTATLDAADLDVTTLKFRPWGRVSRTTVFPLDSEVVITYTHGHTSVPEPVKQAALMLAREYALPKTLPSRATAQTIGDNTYRLTIAGRDGTTGIPDVDSVIKEYGHRKPVVG